MITPTRKISSIVIDGYHVPIEYLAPNPQFDFATGKLTLTFVNTENIEITYQDDPNPPAKSALTPRSVDDTLLA